MHVVILRVGQIIDQRNARYNYMADILFYLKGFFARSKA